MTSGDTAGTILRADGLSTRFREMFGGSPQVFRAPGRVNLIGEHTDYNDGFVMPAALGYYTWIAAAKREDRKLQVHSSHFAETMDLSLDGLAGPPKGHWSDFARGVAANLQSAVHRLSGANLLIEGDIPLGAGLSSSASLELSTALALSTVSGISVPRLELVKLCQSAEHEYIGTRCGIMDQFVAAFGVAWNALRLDCRSLECEFLPVPPEIRIVVCNSMVKRELASCEYNLRRADCEEGVKLLQSRFPAIHALRDVTIRDLEQNQPFLPSQVYRRCQHVITENQRVLQAAEALRTVALEEFGDLMYQSHASLRNDYDVSCEELDLLVDLAASSPGVYGSRMTGGGFGGCTVTLIRSEYVNEFVSRTEQAYQGATGKAPEIYICEPVGGAEQVYSEGDRA